MCSFPPPAIINLKQSGSNLKSNCFENSAPALVSQFDSMLDIKQKIPKIFISIGSKTGCSFWFVPLLIPIDTALFLLKQTL